MSIDFIFCPLCGATKWNIDRNQPHPDGKVASYKCNGCKNFTYKNITSIVKHSILVGITQTTRLSIDAKIEPYFISVNYKVKQTDFLDCESGKLLLSVNTAVAFNWYKNEELINKVKKYLVFS